MEYPTTQGKYGTIYCLAKGLNVVPTKYQTWQLSLKHKGGRKRRNFGPGDEGLQRAVKAGELLAERLGLALETGAQPFTTVSEAAERWLTLNRARWSINTLERYGSIVRDFVNPAIGLFPVDGVNRNHIKALLVDALGIRSPKTVELIHAVVSGIFTEAIDHGFTKENPATGLLKKVLPPKQKRNQRAPDPFPKADLNRLLETAWRHLKEPFSLILEAMAHSGMRLGECLAMHRDHLDVSNSQYMISETVRNKRYGLPKTGKRLVDIPGTLAEKLDRHVLALRKEAFRRCKDAGYLFPGITQRMVQGALKRACRLAGVRTRSPHDLRHTYASMLLMEHYSPAYLQKQLGHHSITMTVDIYGHWIPGEGRKDLDQALRGPSKGHGPRAQVVDNTEARKTKKASRGPLRGPKAFFDRFSQ